MNRSAMTLIELMVALTLSAMLMAMLLAMLGQHTRMNERLMQREPFEPWKARLKEQIGSDYYGCRHVQIRPDRIVFEGYSSRGDGGSCGPSKIIWSITPSEQGNWLFRTRIDLLSGQPAFSSKEFVCTGVNRFESQTRLTTDVAPGILRMSIDVDSALEASGDRSRNELDDAIKLVLVRHGGGL